MPVICIRPFFMKRPNRPCCHTVCEELARYYLTNSSLPGDFENVSQNSSVAQAITEDIAGVNDSSSRMSNRSSSLKQTSEQLVTGEGAL